MKKLLLAPVAIALAAAPLAAQEETGDGTNGVLIGVLAAAAVAAAVIIAASGGDEDDSPISP